MVSAYGSGISSSSQEKVFQTNFPELDKYKIKQIDRDNEELEKQEKVIDNNNNG
ncbi:hypothetical protein [Clostridium sp. Marseille-Q7071]